MSVATTLIEGRRLVILQLVNEQGSIGSGEGVLRQALSAYGIPTDVDSMRADMDFLQRAGCLRIEQAHKPRGGVVWIAHLTDAGFLAATGEQIVTGVARRTNLR